MFNPILDILFKTDDKTRMRCARYLGQTEFYNKVTDCPPIMLTHNRIYKILMRPRGMFGAFDIVRIYDGYGRYLTWIPYSINPTGTYWEYV